MNGEIVLGSRVTVKTGVSYWVRDLHSGESREVPEGEYLALIPRHGPDEMLYTKHRFSEGVVLGTTAGGFEIDFGCAVATVPVYCLDVG